MKKKTAYKAPQVRSEKVDLGLFGNYSTNDDGGCGGGSQTPLQFWNPLFHWCCS